MSAPLPAPASASARSPVLSIVIPCFNEAENVRAICEAVARESAKAADSYEIVLIDNGSTDGTRAIIRDICAQNTNVRAILNTRNFGQMRSPTHGIFQAGGQAVIGMCADFQDPPDMIGSFVREWRAGAQIVLAKRRREKTPIMLRIVRKLGYALLSRYGDYPVIPGATGFGLYDRSVVDTLAGWNEPEPFFRGMIIESGYRIAVIPFDRPQRAAGESKNGVRSLFSFAVSGLSGSARSWLRMPLIVSLLAGVLTAMLIAGASITVIAGQPNVSLMWLAAGSAAFTIIMLSIGLTAEQVRLLAERSRNVPLVIEEERINFPAALP